jgi:hypothetical protein
VFSLRGVGFLAAQVAEFYFQRVKPGAQLPDLAAGGGGLDECRDGKAEDGAQNGEHEENDKSFHDVLRRVGRFSDGTL